MLDFEKELDKLLAGENWGNAPPEMDELMALLNEGRELLSGFSKKQNDISMQIEEIYDLTKDADESAKTLLAEKEKVNRLLRAVIGLSDIIEDFYAFTRSGVEPELERHANMMWKNSGAILETCAVTRLGEEGQPLNPSIHSVQSAEKSKYPRECVSRVLQSGYRYIGAVLRKSAVVISSGEGNLYE